MHSLLSRTGILENLGTGIIIDPYEPGLLKNCSYDVRIGQWYYRVHEPMETGDILFNPYDAEMIDRYYGEPILAPYAKDIPLYEEGGRSWMNIDPEDQVIMMSPGELILSHTLEFIGGTKAKKSGRCFNSEMKARSSIGRLGIEVCRCAGWGDIGYINRWTMEIVCTTLAPMPLLVGTPVGQMKFYEVDPIADEFVYGIEADRDGYQKSVDLSVIKENWRPTMMVPRPIKVFTPS